MNIQNLNSRELKRIYEMGPEEYDRELEEQERDGIY